MRISTRIIVVVALLTIVFGGVTSAFAPGEGTIYAARVSPEIEGTWLVMVTTPDGLPPFPSLVTYASGGALTVTDSSVSPALGNVYQGTWAKIGPHKYAFTFLGFIYDEAGVFTSYFRGHETVQVEPGGNAYNGVSTGEILDVDMNVIATMSSTTHATRISVK